MNLTSADAQARVLVMVRRDDRPTITGRLLSVPGQSTRRSNGGRYRIQLASGSVISADPEDVTLLYEETA